MYWKHTLNATSLHNLPPIDFFNHGFPIALIDPERRDLDHCNWRGLSTTIKMVVPWNGLTNILTVPWILSMIDLCVFSGGVFLH